MSIKSHPLNRFEIAILDSAKETGTVTLDDAVSILSQMDDAYWFRTRVRRFIEHMKKRGLLKQVDGAIKTYEIPPKEQVRKSDRKYDDSADEITKTPD